MQSTWEEIYCCVPAVSSFDSRLTRSTTPWSPLDHPPECTEGTRRAPNPIRSQIGTQTQVSEIYYFCVPASVAPRLPNNQYTLPLASSDKGVRDAGSGLAVSTAEQKLCGTQTLSSQNIFTLCASYWCNEGSLPPTAPGSRWRKQRATRWCLEVGCICSRTKVIWYANFITDFSVVTRCFGSNLHLRL